MSEYNDHDSLDSYPTESAEEKARRKPGPKPGWKDQLVSFQPSNLYLVEGVVRMVPISAGENTQQSEQSRIVYADSHEQAIEKYKNFFVSLSSNEATYVVIGSSCSQAIV